MARTFIIALQDPGTLTAAAAQDYAIAPEDCYLIDYNGSVGTAPTGATAIFDVNKNGTTIFTTQANRPTVAISGTTMTETPPDVRSFRRGDRVSLDCDQIGSTVAGADAVIALRFRALFNRQ